MAARSVRLVFAALILPQLAYAQLGILDKVFPNVTDVNAFVLMGRSWGGDPLISGGSRAHGLRGMGIEVSFGLGTFITSRTCALEPDTTATLHERRVSREPGEPVDTTDVYTIAIAKVPADSACKDTPSLSGELALGYSQLTGFRGRSMQLSGTIEELPALTVYLALQSGKFMDFYLGVRTGLAQLKSTRAYLGDALLTASGSTYQLGIAPGVVMGKPNSTWGFFAELAWTYRKFSSVDWVAPQGVAIPLTLREPTRFSTVTLALGAQISFRDEAEKK